MGQRLTMWYPVKNTGAKHPIQISILGYLNLADKPKYRQLLIVTSQPQRYFHEMLDFRPQLSQVWMVKIPIFSQ